MSRPPLRADGKLESTITCLEMFAPPQAPPLPSPRADLTVTHVERPSVGYYRYLYNTVGEPWLWGDRRKLDDDALAAVVQHPRVSVNVLRAGEETAGYVELDSRVEGEVELAYLGILPAFIGQKLGPYLLDWALRAAWAQGPRRVWVHTCTLDHPSALAMYQRAGLQVYQVETELGDDPRALGLMG